MSIYAAIASHFTTNIAQLGGVPTYLGRIPQGVNPPGILFNLVGGNPIVTHDGDNPTRREIFQFDGVANKLSDAVVIRENIRKLLKTIPNTYSDTFVQSCVPYGSPRDRFDEVNLRWNAQQDFLLYYTVVTGG